MRIKTLESLQGCLERERERESTRFLLKNSVGARNRRPYFAKFDVHCFDSIMAGSFGEGLDVNRRLGVGRVCDAGRVHDVEVIEVFLFIL